MNRTDVLRDSIIDKLLTISNKDYLAALYKLVERSTVNDDFVELSDEQIVMLQLSEQDIKDGNFTSQTELDKSDLKWLKEV
ncbi:MAG: hypothetical protein WCK78_08935 [Paludibacter sp.]